MKPKKRYSELKSKQTVLKGKFVDIDVDPNLKELCEREAFYLLGKLSTQFSELEELIQEVISYLVMGENFFGKYLLEKNTLDTNIKMLTKLNEYYEVEVEHVRDLLREIDKIRVTRNRLIHGTWFIHSNVKKEDVIINVRTNKIEHPSADSEHKSWSNITENDYKLEEIEQQVAKIYEINNKLHSLRDLLKARSEEE